MKFPFRNKLKQSLLLLALCLATITAWTQIPSKPIPPRLVNDLAGLLNPDQLSRLESKLVAFNDTSSTQIAVVIVKTLGGYDKAELAIRIGEEWGVGQKGFNNGIVVLVKPKYDREMGEVHIATGYGLEAVIPDAIAKRIVENEMIPAFKMGDYYKGINDGVDTLIGLASGEYTAAAYGKDPGIWAVLIVLGILILIISLASRKRSHVQTLGGEFPWWLMMTMMNSGKGSGSSSWGGFPSGGRSGGGFGGFGGGSFGGGGAGGRW